MAYQINQWVDGQSPGLSAQNLRRLENAVRELDLQSIRIQINAGVEEIWFNSTSNRVVSTLPNTKRIVCVEIMFYEDIFDFSGNRTGYHLGDTFLLELNNINNKGSFYARKPSSIGTNVKVDYYFENVSGLYRLNVAVGSGLVFACARVKWTYREV